MSKYEIYQTGKLPPLTVIEADDFNLTCIQNNETGECFHKRLEFKKSNNFVAIFNWDNIAGFRILESEVEAE